jgi:hypothetical protein
MPIWYTEVSELAAEAAPGVQLAAAGHCAQLRAGNRPNVLTPISNFSSIETGGKMRSE